MKSEKLIYKSRNFITLLKKQKWIDYNNIYKSRNFITLLKRSEVDADNISTKVEIL